MSVRSNIFAAIAAAAVLGVVSQASANTYDVNLTVGDATATGFISGIVGNSNSDVGAPFNLTLTEGLTSATLVGGGAASNSQVVASPPSGNSITATDNQVLFNFSNSGQEYVEFYLGSGGALLCFQTYAACGGTGAGIVIEVAGNTLFQSQIGNSVITSVSSTPLPAALPLFASALIVFGLLGWHKKRRAQAVAF